MVRFFLDRNLVILLILLAYQDGYTGAWTQKRGHFFNKVGLLRFDSSSQYLLNGDEQPLSNNGQVIDVTFYDYFEYGLFDDLTFVGTIPVKRVSFSCAIEGCGRSTSGLSDIYAGFRYKLAESSWITSIQAGIKLATGYETDEQKLDTAPPLGDGQADVEFRLLLGRSIANGGGYLNLDAGFRARSGEPVDEVPFAVEAGIRLTKSYMLIGKIHGVRGIKEDDDQQNFTIVNGRIENFVGTGALEDFVKAQAQLIYNLTSTIDISFEFDQVVTGRNTSQASTVGIGLAIHN